MIPVSLALEWFSQPSGTLPLGGRPSAPCLPWCCPSLHCSEIRAPPLGQKGAPDFLLGGGKHHCWETPLSLLDVIWAGTVGAPSRWLLSPCPAASVSPPLSHPDPAPTPPCPALASLTSQKPILTHGGLSSMRARQGPRYLWGDVEGGGAAQQSSSIVSPIKVVRIHLLTQPPAEIDIY